MYNPIKTLKDFLEDVKEHGLIRGYEGPSVSEIANRMTPIPYENIEHLLPKPFAKNLTSILNN